MNYKTLEHPLQRNDLFHISTFAQQIKSVNLILKDHGQARADARAGMSKLLTCKYFRMKLGSTCIFIKVLAGNVNA